jgi:hypothetical protein
MATRQLWIFVDWDETITNHDTLSLIAPPDSDSPDAPPPFSFFVEYYATLLRRHEQRFGPRDTLERQFDYLDSLSAIENASVANVEQRGLFKGVTDDDLIERAKQVEFRNGWEDFVKRVREKENVRLLAVISVNWSRVFMQAALRRIHDDEFFREVEFRANVCDLLIMLTSGY